ncbi:NAD-dependent epimerase/dehydratase family protein [Nocardioides sp. GCM10027113]|uniref:polysaccharide biosynthesis C-terminal domain-containing protein n=1 Tax=unclassified Nocardioides TaxID=2615069 RepID=UPI0036072069
MTAALGRVTITGGHGFLGWHLSCHLRAVHGTTPVRLGRSDLSDGPGLTKTLRDTDTLFHLAGVNRGTDEEVEAGNIRAARSIAAAVAESESPATMVYANTIHAERDDPYGRGKRRAAEILRSAVEDRGGRFVDVLLPNLFGEHGRPGYNSFVATFAAAIAKGETPTVSGDREIPLLHAQRAASAMVSAATEGSSAVVRPAGVPTTISGVAETFTEFTSLYRHGGQIPDLSDSHRLDLFNTFRSYLFPEQFPLFVEQHSDQRGRLFEAVRSHGGTGQGFVSTTAPGARRGDHYHLRKVERFFVVRGEAEIALRRLYDDKIVRFRVSGDRPAYVDMPTMWVHNITNVGADELVTVFWADQLLDASQPDQYPELVEISST